MNGAKVSAAPPSIKGNMNVHFHMTLPVICIHQCLRCALAAGIAFVS